MPIIIHTIDLCVQIRFKPKKAAFVLLLSELVRIVLEKSHFLLILTYD